MRQRHSSLASAGLLLLLAYAPAMGQDAPSAAAAGAAAAGAPEAVANATDAPAAAAAAASFVVAPKIIGGLNAPADRLRHQVVLADKTSAVYCGGSLVVTEGNPARTDVVLTAAHCGSATTDFAVAGANTRVNTASRTTSTAGAPRVARFFAHPEFVDSDVTSQNQANDAALIFLSACVHASAAAAPARLATQQELDAAVAKTWLISGVGTTSKGATRDGSYGALPPVVQYGYVRYMDRATCNAKPAVKNQVSDSMICAYGLPSMNGIAKPPRMDTCQGDSGGPLTLNAGSALAATTDPINSNSADDRVAGIVSWGEGCGQLESPGVYTSVPVVRDWITWNIEAVPSACSTTAAITVLPVSTDRSFAAAPDAVVKVERSQAATFCAAECRRRALFEDGCVAYSINWPPAGTVPAVGLPAFKPRVASETVTLKTTPRSLAVDLAFCDIYKARVPPRVCKAGETRLACAWPSMGSRRLRYT